MKLFEAFLGLIYWLKMMSCCSSTNPEDTWEPEDYYPIRQDCRGDVPKTRFIPKPRNTLSARRWHSAFTEDGHLDIGKVLLRIQKGGVHPTVKGAVWEFLLGCYDPNSSFDARNQLRQSRRIEYNDLKSKCQEMEPTIGSGNILTAAIITDDGQPMEDETNSTTQMETNNIPLNQDVVRWKLTLHQIGLDVVRTDRALVYYETKENDAKLWDILAIYSWFDKDIGYCQGMNDLCSPISILIENEADAFWCFEHLMQRVRANFKCTTSTIGVRSQLNILSSVMKAVDPKLHEHLEKLDGGEYLFAFRMLMVLFRREFSFVDTLHLWELIWAAEYNPNLFSRYKSNAAAKKSTNAAGNADFLKQCGKFERKNFRSGQRDNDITLTIFLVAGVLEVKNRQILTEAKGLDDVVKILNEITGSLDAKKACNKALKIHKKYLANKPKAA
ncbi:hypothetical protein HPP92_025748 [Vanilla planifolia]|uniref:Rab-GAP TBC domain-containing protein n=1 Tax=Vanilla planifolia TaxID=51239 RepID=A0A835U819_VANPL|nr:hypothetical protein HPP92_025748 [Vanilla planifolia]